MLLLNADICGWLCSEAAAADSNKSRCEKKHKIPPLAQKIPPLAQTSGYATDCEGGGTSPCRGPGHN